MTQSPKRVFLFLLIASVLASACMGILAILSGSFGWLEVRVLLTTATISIASICALTNAALWESKRAKPLSALGFILTILGAALLIAIIWLEPRSDQFWRLTLYSCILAIATSHACLLSLAKLSKQFAWSHTAAYALIYSLAFLIIYLAEANYTGEGLFRLIGINSILVAAISIMIPVFHRLSAADFVLEKRGDYFDAGRTKSEVLCPKCGFKQSSPLGEISCHDCGCKFFIKILES